MDSQHENEQMKSTEALLIQKDIIYIKTDIGKVLDEIKVMNANFNNQTEQLKKEFVTQIEFQPIKNVVYGLVGFTLISVLTAIMALVIMRAK